MVSSYKANRNETESAAEETVDLLSAPPLHEPQLSEAWVKTQLSRGGAAASFDKFYDNCAEADEFYLGEFDYSVPLGGTKVNLGTFHSIIETLVAHASPRFMDIDVPAPSPRAQARAELIEKFLNGAHHMLEQNTPIKREIVKHQGLYGVSLVKFEFAGSQWGEMPEPPEEGGDMADYEKKVKEISENRRFKFPIISEVVNPQECVWDTASTHPRWIIRNTEIDSEWVMAHFPDFEGEMKDGKCEFAEVWTSTHVGYMASGRWALEPRRHAYGRIPWILFHPQTGIKTIGNKPEHMYRGIGAGNFGMIKAESRLASQYLDIVSRNAWSSLNFKGPRGMTEEVMQEFSQEPGARNYVPPNVDIEPQQTAEAPQSILQAMNTLERAIEANTVPAVARGERPVGAASGYHTAVLAGIASLNFGAVVDATERGFQEANEIVLRIVEDVIGDTVTVFGMTEAGSMDARIKPNDIRGHYVSAVRLTSTSPEEQERKLSLWRDTWRAGFVDWTTALRKAGVSNPLEVVGNRIAEDFFNLPDIQQAFSALAAQSLPILQQAVEAAQQGAGGIDTASIAENILAGGVGLPNAGQFGQGNQAAVGAPTGGQVRPVMPGSVDEQNLIGRQMASPRRGPQPSVGADVPPGLDNIGA
jgi:hypothetical protein|tara:strand:+ start:3324 stop:5255 length:1932 start_codon:yes stop_codon:yes gene_type:complete